MKYIAILTLSLMMVSEAKYLRAQSSVAVQYTISFPMGNTKDFIGTTSFRGATLDFRHSVTPNIAVGFSGGWSTFYEKSDRGTYTTSDESLAVNGVLYRYVNSIPLLVAGDYYFKPDETFSPFVGLGVGVTYNRLDNEMGLYTVEDDAWQFTLAPEAGLRYGIKEELWGYVSVRYNNSFEASDVDAQSYLSLNIGLMFGSF